MFIEPAFCREFVDQNYLTTLHNHTMAGKALEYENSLVRVVFNHFLRCYYLCCILLLGWLCKDLSIFFFKTKSLSQPLDNLSIR